MRPRILRFLVAIPTFEPRPKSKEARAIWTRSRCAARGESQVICPTWSISAGRGGTRKGKACYCTAKRQILGLLIPGDRGLYPVYCSPSVIVPAQQRFVRSVRTEQGARRKWPSASGQFFQPAMNLLPRAAAEQALPS